MLNKSVVCNKCGKEFSNTKDRPYLKNLVHNFILTFRYGSKHDLDQWDFCLCENCIEEFTNSFKVPVTVKEYLKSY